MSSVVGLTSEAEVLKISLAAEAADEISAQYTKALTLGSKYDFHYKKYQQA